MNLSSLPFTYPRYAPMIPTSHKLHRGNLPKPTPTHISPTKFLQTSNISTRPVRLWTKALSPASCVASSRRRPAARTRGNRVATLPARSATKKLRRQRSKLFFMDEFSFSGDGMVTLGMAGVLETCIAKTHNCVYVECDMSVWYGPWYHKTLSADVSEDVNTCPNIICPRSISEPGTQSMNHGNEMVRWHDRSAGGWFKVGWMSNQEAT